MSLCRTPQLQSDKQAGRLSSLSTISTYSSDSTCSACSSSSQGSPGTSSNCTTALGAHTHGHSSPATPAAAPGVDKDVKFYKFDVAKLPDELYKSQVPVDDWLAECETTTNPRGFPKDSLNRLHSISWIVQLERIVGFTLYQFLNVLPFLLLPMWILYCGVATHWSKALVLAVMGYFLVLLILVALLEPIFLKHYDQKRFMLADIRDVKHNQYVYTERNTMKYLSVKFVWPASIQRPSPLEKTSVIFCMVPHGVVSWGIAAYPLWSKVWNDRVCRWSIAPIVLKVPLVRYLVRKVGYIPANQRSILETLTKRNENVGIVLDGIAGMFSNTRSSSTSSSNDNVVETVFLKTRKGIVKIALKAGVPIVPVYGFGHTSLYTVCVDRFGIMERLSNALQTSITPFFGRWGWLLGPPRRVPVTVCLGEPVHCPQMDNPSQEQIDFYHNKLLNAYRDLFDTHKEAYGWGDKTLRFV